MKIDDQVKKTYNPSYTTILPFSSQNLLLTASSPLLGLLVSWKTKVLQGSQEKFRLLLMDVFQRFVEDVQDSYPMRTILAARYCLCAALDETIMNNQQEEMNWAENTLLNVFYQETFGGERFYLILDNMLENEQENADILEVLYILLRLGFKGKNFNKDPLIIEAEQRHFFEKIFPYLSKSNLLLEAPTPISDQPKPKRLFFWVFILSSIAILALLIFALDKNIDRKIQPILALLENIFNNKENQ